MSEGTSGFTLLFIQLYYNSEMESVVFISELEKLGHSASDMIFCG